MSHSNIVIDICCINRKPAYQNSKKMFLISYSTEKLTNPNNILKMESSIIEKLCWEKKTDKHHYIDHMHAVYGVLFLHHGVIEIEPLASL